MVDDKIAEAVFNWLCSKNFIEFNKEEFTPWWKEKQDLPYWETRNKLIERIKKEVSNRVEFLDILYPKKLS